MNYQEYISEKREIYDILIQFIEDESDDDYIFQELIDTFNRQKIQETEEELVLFFRLLVQISNNHHRFPNFFEKTKRILQYFHNQHHQQILSMKLINFIKLQKTLLTMN